MGSTFFQSLVTAQSPWLPGLVIQYWGLHGAWGLVIGSLTFIFVSSYKFEWRGRVAIIVAMWCLWPGTASPSYWLGLAFQSPSLMAVVLCVFWAAGFPKDGSLRVVDARAKESFLMLLVSAGSFLGWLLLGDTLAWWPFSIYAMGFSTFALASVCALTYVLWFRRGQTHAVQSFRLTLTVVITLYVLTRLPSGNLWDALLDPLLWIILQVMGVRILITRFLHRWRVSQATRA